MKIWLSQQCDEPIETAYDRFVRVDQHPLWTNKAVSAPGVIRQHMHWTEQRTELFSLKLVRLEPPFVISVEAQIRHIHGEWSYTFSPLQNGTRVTLRGRLSQIQLTDHFRLTSRIIKHLRSDLHDLARSYE
jgi:hypothetical protein